MARLINARLSDGQLASFELKNGRIVAKSRQTALLEPAFATIALSDAEDFAMLAADDVVDGNGAWLLAGMVDAHVHSRDPGMTHKESWQSLAAAAFKGGVVAVCDMPNTNPATVDRAGIEAKRILAEESGLLYRLYLGVTQRNLGQLGGLLDDAELPLCGLKIYYGSTTGNILFSDLDGLTKALGSRRDVLITFHAEDQDVIDENTANSSASPICNSLQEYAIHSTLRCTRSAVTATRKILEWAWSSGHRVHLAHVSTPEEVELVLTAQAKGAKITMEVAPHHLYFSDDDYSRFGGQIKVNPPVRSALQRDELRRLTSQGVFNLFATDHAPHTMDEKSTNEYKKCPSGIPSLEFFAPLLLSLADKIKMSLTEAVKMATCNAAQLLHWNDVGELESGRWASFVWMERRDVVVGASDITARCGWSPYIGTGLSYRVRSTWQKGVRVYKATDS